MEPLSASSSAEAAAAGAAVVAAADAGADVAADGDAYPPCCRPAYWLLCTNDSTAANVVNPVDKNYGIVALATHPQTECFQSASATVDQVYDVDSWETPVIHSHRLTRNRCASYATYCPVYL